MSRQYARICPPFPCVEYVGFDRHVETATMIALVNEEGRIDSYAVDSPAAVDELKRYLHDTGCHGKVIGLFTRDVTIRPDRHDQLNEVERDITYLIAECMRQVLGLPNAVGTELPWRVEKAHDGALVVTLDDCSLEYEWENELPDACRVYVGRKSDRSERFNAPRTDWVEGVAFLVSMWARCRVLDRIRTNTGLSLPVAY